MLNQGFKDKISSGFRWSFARQIIAQLCNFCFGIYLARLLLPADFGLVAMVTVFTGFAGVLQEAGLTNAFIYFDNPKEEETSTAFWLTMAISFSIAVLIYYLGPLIVDFYDEPALLSLVSLLALNFFLVNLGTFPNAVLRKQLRFEQLFWINIIALVMAGIGSVWMALSGWGVYSIVARLLIGSAMNSILLWSLAKWWPKLVFRWSLLRTWFQFSIPLLANNVLNYFVRNIDDLLIGKYIGQDTLGNYNRAYSLMLLPIRQITSVFSSVLFPSLSILKADTENAKSLFLKIVQLIAFISFPAMFGLSVLAEPFILTLLGAHWANVIPILQILSLLGAIQSIGNLQGNVFTSQGATGLQLRVGLVSKLLMITSIFVGLQWGVMGVTIAYTIASSLAFFWEFYFMGRLINLSIKTVLLSLWTVFLISIIMMVMLTYLDAYLLWLETTPLLRLLLGILIGGGFYLSSHIVFKTDIWSLFRQTIKQQLYR